MHLAASDIVRGGDKFHYEHHNLIYTVLDDGFYAGKPASIALNDGVVLITREETNGGPLRDDEFTSWDDDPGYW